MAKISRVVGTTSQIVEIFVLDSTSTTGAGKTGLTNASVTCYYKRNAGSASVSSTVNSISTLGTFAGSATNAAFGVVDGTNMPGLYEFHLPNNALVSGADEVVLMLTGAGIVPVRVEIELTATNNQDAVHGGMSALPNTACTTNASLLTSGTGTDQLEVASGRVDLGKITGSAVSTTTAQIGVNVVQYNAQTAATDGNGLPKVDLVDIAGAAVATGSAQIGVNVVNIAGAAAALDGNNLLKVDVVDIAGAAVAAGSAQIGVNVVNIAGAAAALDSNNLLKVDTEDWKGTAVAAPATAGVPDVNAKNVAGSAAAAEIASIVWDEPTSNHQTAGTTGKALTTAAAAGADPWLTALPGSYGAGTAGKILGSIVSEIWDEPTSNHQTAGTTGKALTSAGSAGDPWSTALPGNYGAGTAGRILGGTPNGYTQAGSGATPYIDR